MNIGFDMCGSFCTFSKIFPVMQQLSLEHTVTPIFSEATYNTDTRFGMATDHRITAENICGIPPIHSIVQAAKRAPARNVGFINNIREELNVLSKGE